MIGIDTNVQVGHEIDSVARHVEMCIFTETCKISVNQLRDDEYQRLLKVYRKP